MKAIVLAGGFGTRIQPLTNSIPKPMLPIVNKPMMEHIICKLKDDLGVKDIAVLLYFKPEVIKDYFGDGKKWGVNITYIQPDDDYGTAGAVGFARELMDETFIIVSGDLVTDFDFKKIEKFHKEKESKLTITLTSVENPLQFGVVITDKDSQIERFLEKPSWGEVFSDTINTGIYMIEPEIFDYIPVEQNFDFAKDLFPTLMAEGIKLWGYSASGYWRDVGNPQSYKEVFDDIFDGQIELNIAGEKKELESAMLYLGKKTSIAQNVKMSGLVVIDEGVEIGEGTQLHNCIIAKGCKIAKDVKLNNCILYEGVTIDAKSTLTKAVVCANTKIAKRVKAKNGVIISEGCEIDKGVIFTKDVTVWPNKVINEDSIVSTNIIWGELYKSSLFEDGRVVGKTNVELSCEMTTKLAESFGTILPVGSRVYISRDYHKSSRMLKRAFLSGMLSTGIDVIDVQNIPSCVMRHNLAKDERVAAGVHFRQSITDQSNSEIVFYTSEALPVDTNLAKNIEKIFFKEEFRRVNYNNIGEIYYQEDLKEKYIVALKEKLDIALFKAHEPKVAADIMYGTTSDIYPAILNELMIESIVLNGYKDDKRLTKLPSLINTSHKNLSQIVKTMGLSCGFLIYPNGQKLQMISDEGELIYDYKLLLIILYLLNETDQKFSVFLPAWAPDFVEFENLHITRGKLEKLKADDLQKYDLIATTDGHFSFSEFGLSHDAIFSSLKILELLLQTQNKTDEILQNLPQFCFKGENIPCTNAKKGLMMRKFMEESKGKKSSYDDGVKIWLGEDEWILMVPSQNSQFLNIYLQARDEERANEIYFEYKAKIAKW